MTQATRARSMTDRLMVRIVAIAIGDIPCQIAVGLFGLFKFLIQRKGEMKTSIYKQIKAVNMWVGYG
jgi:hypothetical protein